eukprot:6433301-Pyramimonas_sp.AAC.1
MEFGPQIALRALDMICLKSDFFAHCVAWSAILCITGCGPALPARTNGRRSSRPQFEIKRCPICLM